MTTDRRILSGFPRLNPFAFPSDTDFRFVLLIVVVIGASLFIYSMLYNSIPFNWQRLQAIEAQCTAAAMERYPANTVPEEAARYEAIYACTAPFYRERALVILGGVVLLLGVALIIYLMYPAFKIRRDKLVPLLRDDAPDMSDDLAALCREIDLVSPPQFLLQPLNHAISGQAFGRRGRYYVVLNAGLVVQYRKNHATFRGVVLHELAHLRNADVDKTYFSIAVGFAFLLLALLPLIIMLIGKSLIDILDIGGRVLIQAAFIYLAILAIWRAREIYADVRASHYDGPEGGLRHMLEKLTCPEGPRWRYLFRLHPDPGDRLTLFLQTDRLFPLGFWEAFTAGFATALIADIVDTWIGACFPTSNSFLSSLVTGALLAALIVGVVGVGTWRATFAAMVRGKSPAGLLRLGIGTGLGFLLGQRLSLSDYAFIKSGSVLTGNDLLIFFALWLPIVVLSFYAFIRWIASGASTWLEVAVRGRSPRPVYRLVLFAFGLWLAVWLATLIYNGSWYHAAAFLPPEEVLTYFSSMAGAPTSALSFVLLLMEYLSQSPFTLLVLVSLWILPLSTWFWRNKMSHPAQASWAFLEPSPRPLIVAPQPPLRLGLALAIGTIGGLLASVLLLGVGMLVIFVSSPSDKEVWFLEWQFPVAAWMQVMIAIFATCQIKRLGSLHGLCAAFIGGCFLTVAAFVSFLLYLSSLGFDVLHLSLPYSLTTLLWNFFSNTVNEGALLSLPVVLLVSLFMRWLRSSTKSDAIEDQSNTANVQPPSR